MYYEINVSLNGKHFFATHERSLVSKWEAENALKIFLDKFPNSEGYSINISHWEHVGKNYDVNKFSDSVCKK